MPQNLEGCTLNILMSQTEKTWYTEREKGTTEKKVLWCQRYTCTNTPTTDSFQKMIIKCQKLIPPMLCLFKYQKYHDIRNNLQKESNTSILIQNIILDSTVSCMPFSKYRFYKHKRL